MRSSPPANDVLIAVAVPVPGLGTLTYRVPSDIPRPPKGARVRVPLGGRTVTGCVVGTDAEAPAGTVIRAVSAVLDQQPFLPPTVVDLALWVGEYYASGPGAALAMAMPPAARGAEHSRFRTVPVVSVAVPDAAAREPRGRRQRELLAWLRQRGTPVSMPALQAEGFDGALARALAKQGLVRIDHAVHERDPFEARNEGQGIWTLAGEGNGTRPLTEEQTAALDHLRAAAAEARFRPTLLQGVTGSGKTEVYLRLARDVVASRRHVLVLVPEIGLTPAMAGQFRATFGDRVAIQHSGLSTGERHDQWHRIRRGDVDVVVGTRSAVFAPLESPGLIIVDEEHDASYKQDEMPRYHGRDTAVMRGRMEGALVVLGSATPSLESAVNASTGRYDRLVLTKRVLGRPLAAVRVVDMRREFAARGPAVTVSQPLLEAMAERLERREQSLVLLNRRGFATVIFCRQCGATIECPHCSVTLTFHRAARRLRCHYCNYMAPVPERCAECGGEYLQQSGFGTERIEADLRERFPDARIARVDRDAVRRRGAFAQVLGAMARGEVDILIGTQMIAKGHDFPAVTLVGVISADVGLGLADFRAAERTFQLLTQVVGRAGRGTVAGAAIIQTLYPDHYSVMAAASQDYATFFARELEFRKALQYPPAVGLINVVVKGRAADAAMRDAADLAQRVRQARPGGRVLGPAPAALAKIKDEHRAQFLVKGTHRAAMRTAVLRALEGRPDLKRRTTIDVDPVSMI